MKQEQQAEPESTPDGSGKAGQTMRKPSGFRRTLPPPEWKLFTVTAGPHGELKLEELASLNCEEDGLKLLSNDKIPEGNYAIVPVILRTVRFAAPPRIVSAAAPGSILLDSVPPRITNTWEYLTGEPPKEPPRLEYTSSDEGYVSAPDVPKPSPLFTASALVTHAE